MRQVALRIEYVGEAFQGFQSQLNRAGGTGKAPPTVQDELEKQLSQLLGERIVVHCAGRTDTGVHACGQLVSFLTSNPRPAEAVRLALNKMLDERIRVLSAHEVGRNFRPRWDAGSRTYHYYLLPGRPSRHDPFFGRRAWILEEALDLEAMRRAAVGLLGTHDFSAYAYSLEEGTEARRELRRIDLLEGAAPFADGPFARLSQLVRVEVEGRSFLRRMVRQIVGNLVSVGLGKWDEDRPRRVLEERQRVPGALCAPAHGLYLVDVAFPKGLAEAEEKGEPIDRL